MDLIAEARGKIYGAISLDNAGDFLSPFVGFSYVCLLWDHTGLFTITDQSLVAKALLESGCRYVVCGGNNCEAWHDTVDEWCVEKHLNDPDEVLDSVHVMTTWHNDESPDDVAFFFVLNTNFDDLIFQHYLVLHIGNGAAVDLINAAVRKHALDTDTI